MDKFAVLGELLYIISNYEKGRLKTTGIWSRRYINSLRESLEMMGRITELLAEDTDVSQEEIMPIMEFYRQNLNIIFPASESAWIGEDGLKELEVKKDQSQTAGREEVICHMRKILSECFDLLERKGRRYKYRLFYLLMAFHNLPKVYLDATAETLCNIGISAISEEDAIKHANSYMKKG